MVDARLRQSVIEGDYWVDPGAVAEAILRRLGDDGRDSGVLEPAQIDLPLSGLSQDEAPTRPHPA